jgi:hypothetical protein
MIASLQAWNSPLNLRRKEIRKLGREIMKATLLIRKDHERIHELFEKYQKTSAGQTGKRELLDKIQRELSLYSTVKNEVFYSELKSASTNKNTVELVDSLYEDLCRIDSQLQEIANSNGNDNLLDSRVSQLIELVDAHVAREEEELFAEARRVLSEQRLEELGLEMDYRKRLFTQAAA